jgi:uncharacterized protein (DUF2267 family)
MSRRPDAFAHAESTALRWLDVLARHLGTTDRNHAHRVLRAWLHVVRDRLTVDAAAHFGAQLPELLRGVYYEGWRPSEVPVRYDVEDFVLRYCDEAGVSAAEAGAVVGAVFAALRELTSVGQLEHLLAQLPPPLCDYLGASGAVPAPPLRAVRADIAGRG